MPKPVGTGCSFLKMTERARIGGREVIRVKVKAAFFTFYPY
jgi:hypothetical protein